MPRRCTVCGHRDRGAIDAALVAGESGNALAGRYNLSPSAVYRHRDNHLPTTLAQAHDAAEVARADDLLAQARELQAKAWGILAQAEEAGELRTALAAIREARGNLELLARLMGELQEQGATVQVAYVQSPEWVALRTRILYALDPYPQAKLAVARALSDAAD